MEVNPMRGLIIDLTRPDINGEGFIGVNVLKKQFAKYREMMLNMRGTTGQRLKYGCESLTPETFYATMQASTVLAPLSSYFVTVDASGNAGLTGASNTSIQGHLICPAGAPGLTTTGNYTTSSTAGGESFPCIFSVDAKYRIPVKSGTYSRANRGKLCDLVVASSVQGAAVQVSTRGHIQLLDGDETTANAWVVARLNPALLTAGNAS